MVSRREAIHVPVYRNILAPSFLQIRGYSILAPHRKIFNNIIIFISLFNIMHTLYQGIVEEK